MELSREEKIIKELKNLLNISDPNISNKEVFNLLNGHIEGGELDIPLAFSRKINEILITKQEKGIPPQKPTD